MLNRFAHLLGCLALVVGFAEAASAQRIWSGSGVTFSKAASADFNLAANQDRITSDTWITRKNASGLFNIKTETGYLSGTSPANTEWAYNLTGNGNTGQTIAATNHANLVFDDWTGAINGGGFNQIGPPGTVNLPGVLHLISEDIYIDITITSWGGSGGGAFSYTRGAEPSITVSTSTISRTVTQGSNASASSFTVRDAGGGTLRYSLSDTNTNATDWISLSPTSGSSSGELDTINVTFNTSGLPVGSYSGTITVSGSSAGNSPQTIAVSLTVNAQPVIALSESSFSRNVTVGSNAPGDSFTVSNSGGGNFSYTITDTNTNAIDWISVSPTSGTSNSPDTISVLFNTTGLPVNNYSGTITVTAAGTTNTPQTIAVSLSVTPLPTIALSKSVLSPSTTPGSNATADSFTVTNTGGGTLNYSITDINNNATDWITVSPNTGSSTGEADNVNVTFNTAGLPAGNYSGTITVDAELATNAPQTIDVNLSVSALSTIALSKSMLAPSATVGSNAAADSFTVSNSGGGTLSYSITDTNSNAIDWISVSPTNGNSTGEADNIGVTFNTSGLSIGNYNGSISVSAAGATNTPQVIGVSLSVVASPAISLSRSTISRTVDEGSNPASSSFTVANSGGGTLSYSIADANDDAIDWISLSRTQGTSTGEADEIVVNFDTANLAASSFAGRITVTAAGAANSPQLIAVDLTVVAQPPLLSVSKSTISRTVALGANAASDSFGVTNIGGGALSYSITDTNDDAIDWIAVAPTGGNSTGEADTIAVDFDTSALAANSYAGTITITAAGVSNSPQTIDVSLTVSATPPTISLSRLVISRVVPQGMDAASASFAVTNSGGETLSYTISDSNDDPIDWISPNPTAGSSTGESDTIAIDFTTSGLANGEFEGTITVIDPGATNSPRSIAVLLSVGGNPAIESRWDTFNWDTDNWGPIPEPSSILLNFSALISLAGLHRARTRNRRTRALGTASDEGH